MAKKKRQDPEQRTLSFRQLELSLAIIVGLVITLSFFNTSSITGFVSVNSYSQDLDLTITQDTALRISSQGKLDISNFKVTGNIESGAVRIYLDNHQGQRLLVYDNRQAIKRPPSLITGLAISEGGDGEPSQNTKLLFDIIDPDTPPESFADMPVEERYYGAFENACEETCLIKMNIDPEHSYTLYIYTDQGTRLQLKTLHFTLVEE